MDWTAINLYKGTWISGIYKVLTYNGEQFHAYYICDHYKNWGDNPSKPPLRDRDTTNGYWPSLESAQTTCEVHAQTYTPKPKTVKRAAELLSEMVEKHGEAA